MQLVTSLLLATLVVMLAAGPVLAQTSETAGTSGNALRPSDLSLPPSTRQPPPRGPGRAADADALLEATLAS